MRKFYNEKEVSTGAVIKTYDRAAKITIYNPLNATPGIEFLEERVERRNENGKDLPEKSLGLISGQLEVGLLYKDFTAENALTEFPLVNPVTGEELGATGTYQDLQVLLYSLYFHLAEERDAIIPTEPPTAAPPDPNEPPPSDEPFVPPA